MIKFLKEVFRKAAKKIKVSELVKILTPSPELRDRTVNTIAELGEEAVQDLVPYLKDKEKREAVSEVLERIGNEEAVKALINSSVPGDIFWSRILQKRLSNIGKPSVIPLLEALKGSADRDIKILAAAALAETGDERAARGLLEVLNKSDDRVQVAIIDALGELRAAEAVLPLLNLLSGCSNEIQKTAIRRAIGEIGPPAVDELMEALKGTDMTYKKSVIEILGNINDARLVKPLIEYLRASDDNIAKPAIDALGKKPEAMKTIIEGLNDDEPVFRRNCTSVLGKMLSVGSVDNLLKACRDKDENVARNAITALGEIGDDMAKDNLMQLLRTDNYSHTKTVIDALARMSDKAIPVLINSLSDRDSGVRDRSALALAIIGPRSIVPLLEAVKTGKKYVRDSADEIFFQIGPSAIPDLIRLFLERDEELVNFASDAISAQGHACVWYLGKAMLESPHWPVQKNAAKTLSRIGVNALEPLLKGLKHGEKPVRELAARSIADIGNSVIPELISLLEKKSIPPEYISKTLCHFGTSSIPDLLDYISIRDDTVRRYIGDAIARMGLPAIKPLCDIIEKEEKESRKQQLTMVLVELLRSYRPKEKTVSTSDIEQLRFGIEFIGKYQEKLGKGVLARFGVKFGQGAKKVLMDLMKDNCRDIIIFLDDDEGLDGTEFEITG